jgi:hypothetical protein
MLLLTLLSPDPTVELSTQDDCFLIDMAHLILELRLDGLFTTKVNLFSRESEPGTWVADQDLIL